MEPSKVGGASSQKEILATSDPKPKKNSDSLQPSARPAEGWISDTAKISQLAWECLEIPRFELHEVAEVCSFLLKMLPPRSDPGKSGSKR